MKIIHLCLACFYVDNYSYQENILPRYHKKMGNDVLIVASTESFDSNGDLTYLDASTYYNEDQIKVIRLPYVNYMPHFIAKKIRKYVGLKGVLDRFQPDFIFIHDVQFLDIKIIKEYAKTHSVTIVADCHTDFSNSARSFFSRKVLHGLIYKKCAKTIEPYVRTFYGVLPARVDFLCNIYKVPKGKTELLVMGAEDEKAFAATKEETINYNRRRLGICPDDFLIVFGGKIDKAKKQVLLLMDAVNSLEDASVKLIVFGSVIPEMKHDVEKRISDKVKYVGWATADQAYNYFGMADVVCFPGRHSVFWEQVAGMGIPMILKYWEGTTHVCQGGNAILLYKDSAIEIQESINSMKNKFPYHKRAAMDIREHFMYSKIAERCIQDC